jgi:hypothetical protein
MQLSSPPAPGRALLAAQNEVGKDMGAAAGGALGAAAGVEAGSPVAGAVLIAVGLESVV